MPALGTLHKIFMCRLGERSLQRCLLAYENGNLHIAKTRPLSGGRDRCEAEGGGGEPRAVGHFPLDNHEEGWITPSSGPPFPLYYPTAESLVYKL